MCSSVAFLLINPKHSLMSRSFTESTNSTGSRFTRLAVLTALSL